MSNMLVHHQPHQPLPAASDKSSARLCHAPSGCASATPIHRYHMFAEAAKSRTGAHTQPYTPQCATSVPPPKPPKPAQSPNHLPLGFLKANCSCCSCSSVAPSPSCSCCSKPPAACLACRTPASCCCCCCCWAERALSMRGRGAASCCCSCCCSRASQVGLASPGERSRLEGLSDREVVSHLQHHKRRPSNARHVQQSEPC